MESLQVRTGQISLMILDDDGNERGVFKFNPEDIEVAKRVVGLQTELDEKYKDFEQRAKHCETDEERIDLLDETVTYFKTVIDQCFGEGTSEIVFGGASSLTMFYDFIEGITPYFEQASKKRMEKYQKKVTKKK